MLIRQGLEYQEYLPVHFGLMNIRFRVTIEVLK